MQNHSKRTVLLALLGMSLVGPAFAQPGPTGHPWQDLPASPRSLPGDNLPPFGMLDEHGTLPPPPHLPPGTVLHDPAGPPERTARGPHMHEAEAIVRAAVLACAAKGYAVGAAVVDTKGEARAMLSGELSDGSHVFVAMRKAQVAIAFRMPSSTARDLVARDSSQLSKVTPAMFVEGGAVPFYFAGELMGAIGVSGAAGPVIGAADEACAKEAIRTAWDHR
jgi:uncharacterized protein GlcG (DUF336 family)